jgi:hypothetical protein
MPIHAASLKSSIFPRLPFSTSCAATNALTERSRRAGQNGSIRSTVGVSPAIHPRILRRNFNNLRQLFSIAGNHHNSCSFLGLPEARRNPSHSVWFAGGHKIGHTKQRISRRMERHRKNESKVRNEGGHLCTSEHSKQRPRHNDVGM